MTQTAISTSFSTQALTVTPSLQSAAPSPCRHPLLSSGLVQGTLLYTWLAPGSGHPRREAKLQEPQCGEGTANGMLLCLKA